VALAAQAGARQVVLFHHKPTRTDLELDAIATRFDGAPVPVTRGRRGPAPRPGVGNPRQNPVPGRGIPPGLAERGRALGGDAVEKAKDRGDLAVLVGLDDVEAVH
jgi:hypothetical protein